MSEFKLSDLRCVVVIPTRNRAALLEQCLRALAKQSLNPEEMEIIVVDDGSTDGTAERAQALAEQMCFKVRVLKGQGRGPAAARNIGWRAAKAPIVLFTDDDCEPSAGWAQGLVDFLEANPGYGGAGGTTRRLHESAAARYTDDLGCMDHPGDPADVMYLVSANAAYRRGVLELAGGFNESFPCAGGEDPDLSFRLKARGIRLAKVPAAALRHNHPDSVLGVYRMHHRYGRGEYSLLAVGQPCSGICGRPKALARELKRSAAFYLRRRDLSAVDRVLFAVFGAARAFGAFMGFRHQAKQQPR